MRRLALVLALLAAPAAAADTLRYDCKFATGTKRDGNWIPSVLILHHDRGTGRVIVFDPVIKHFVGSPIEARLESENAARRSFAWSFDTRAGGGRNQTARMGYRMTWYADGRPVRMRAVPSGYDNDFDSEGACKLTPGGRRP